MCYFSNKQDTLTMYISKQSFVLIFVFLLFLMLFLQISIHNQSSDSVRYGTTADSRPTVSWINDKIYNTQLERSSLEELFKIADEENDIENSNTVALFSSKVSVKSNADVHIRNSEIHDTDTNVDTLAIDNIYLSLLGCKKLPDILTIGFEKCGTVALNTYLGIHPQVFLAKEENYLLFNKNTTFDVKQYTENKQCTPPGKLRLDKLAVLGTATKAFKVIPNAKLLAVVKEPVERAMSDYMQRLERGYESDEYNFDSMVASILYFDKPYSLEQSSLFFFSRFIERLQPWIATYGLENIHIVDGDNIVRHPAQELQKVEKFLGINPYITDNHFIYNSTKGFYCLKTDTKKPCLPTRKGRVHPVMSKATRTRLQQYFKPFNEKLFRTIGRNFTWIY